VRIGEVVTRSGVSDKTLRFYEEVGVLDPPKRAPSGYRDYEPTRWTDWRSSAALKRSV
jgi:DNA-binding transcriptional MerR regulator